MDSGIIGNVGFEIKTELIVDPLVAAALPLEPIVVDSLDSLLPELTPELLIVDEDHLQGDQSPLSASLPPSPTNVPLVAPTRLGAVAASSSSSTAPKKRGRPAGSHNKEIASATVGAAATTTVVATDPSQPIATTPTATTDEKPRRKRTRTDHDDYDWSNGSDSSQSPISSNAVSTASSTTASSAALNASSKFNDLKLSDLATVQPQNDEDERALKRQKRLLKNRESAQLSRQRKKQYMEELEKKVEVLNTANDTLVEQVASFKIEKQKLEEELSYLRQLIRQSPTMSPQEKKQAATRNLANHAKESDEAATIVTTISTTTQHNNLPAILQMPLAPPSSLE